MDIQRKAFEESNNVNPDWSFKFDEELQQYVATDFEMTNQVDEFNEHWDTFRAGWDAKAQAVPEWISVEDRMPEYGVLVLIHNRFTFETMHTAKLIQLDGENYWFFESDDDYLHTRYTSHWMSIYKPQEPTHDQS